MYQDISPSHDSSNEVLDKKKNLTWIAFYIETAKKLLNFKTDRKPLLDIIYSLDKKHVGYIKTDDGGRVNDIDPFTVFGIFNRGISHDKRFELCRYLRINSASTHVYPLTSTECLWSIT